MIVMVTGHRPQRLRGQEKEVSKWYAEMLARLQPEVCISGMATGADQLFAIATMDTDADLWCYFPYKKLHYHPQEEYILDHAVFCKYFYEKYDKASYYVRDKGMVDDSDVVLAVYDGNPVGGTYATIQYAKEKGKTIYYYPGFGE